MRTLAILLLICLPCTAQTSASLDLVVKDPSGALISNAHVQLIKNGKIHATAQTNQRGEVRLNKLIPGPYQLHIEAAGFKVFAVDVDVTGSSRKEVSLEIEVIKVDVNVEEDAQVKATNPNTASFSNVMTAEQIAQLPDDPEEFENAINQLAGPGAQIRVNGFRGGKLPPKNQIREIRFRLNPYAAENHYAGFGLVDVVTKPGVNSWHGSFNFGFRDEALNGRQVFAPSRGPEQQRRFGLSLDGPLWKDHTSLFLNVDGSLFFDARPIFAKLPTGTFSDLAYRPSRRLNIDARVEHVLTKTHTARFQFQRNAGVQNNLGVGDFDLAPRGYAQDSTEYVARFADSGVFGKKYFNELRVQARWIENATRSLSIGRTILVPDAFNDGSAQRTGGHRQFDLEIADNVDYALEKHGIRFGGQVEAGRYRSNEFNNAFGTFEFADLEAYEAGLPTKYTQRIGVPLVEYPQYQMGWYVQDDFRLRKNLTLSYGVRHEWQSHVPGKFNIAPRFGFAYSPGKKGTITLRGGAGIFYDWFAAQVYEETLRVDGERQRDLIIVDPSYPDPFSSVTQKTLPPSHIQIDPNLQIPYIIQASFGMETQPFKLFQLRTNYQYQRGVHLLHGRNLNAPVGLDRPDPAVGNITNVESTAYSSGHRWMVNIGPAKFVQGLFWSMNYLLMKNTNEADGAFSLPSDNFNLRADRGPSATDFRHLISGFVNKRLPMGFGISAVFQATSALPYNITTGFDDNDDTVINDRPVGVGRNSARGAGRWEIGSRFSWGADFGPDAEVTAGPQMRVVRVGSGDGAAPPSISMGATKKYRFELYVQAFNLLNHANLKTFAGVQTSSFFGQATSALSPRRLEIGTRFNF
jgi:hypothetical protein